MTNRKNSDSLAAYLATLVSRVTGRSVTTEDIHKILKSNPSILVLDGLDEVAERGLRTKVLDNITSFINQIQDVLGGNLRIVATTRPYGYSEEFDPKHYLHLTLETLPLEKALLYTERWTKAREPIPEEAERIKTTFNICVTDRVVSVLTSTPLQVTILLVIIRARGTPPKQREELFAQYMDTIYLREQKRRPELLRTEKDKIYGLHKYLAYILHKRAEKDETAALIDISEFKEKVLEYLLHCDPLLNEEELKDTMNQIITEAGQRLVLIESPQEGRIGFGLTTIREFFTAAHLVDPAKTTQERDSRFKAIARLPHWRNVALFFAGRVGRFHPGEAPSLIDVCRDIDTERAERFLRRGAELTLEIVDDRALREPHNEVGAIQCGLSLLDVEFVRDPKELIKKIGAFPERYKERIVLPWLEEKFNKVIPTKLELYLDIYRSLFGTRPPLIAAIKRGAEYDSKEVKLWALVEAIKSEVVEKWVVDLMDELVDARSIKKMLWHFFDCWPNLRLYLQYPLSSNIRAAIVLIYVFSKERFAHHESLLQKGVEEFSKIKPEGKYKKNILPLWTVNQLLTISARREIQRRKDWTLSFWLPSIANPKVRSWVSDNASYIKEFCQTFSKEKEPLFKYLAALLEYLPEPHDLEKYINIYETLQALPNKDPLYLELGGVIPRIIGMPPENREKLYKWHAELATLCKHYKSEKQYETDIEDLSELISEKSRDVSNHPHKLLFWIQNECDPSIETFLDSAILERLKEWLQACALSNNSLFLFSWSRSLTHDSEFLRFVIEILSKQLAGAKKPSSLRVVIDFIDWHDPKTKQESEVANQIKNVIEELLAKYETPDETVLQLLEILYWIALGAGVIEEKHMLRLAKLFHNAPGFALRLWYAEKAVSAQPTLESMLQSENLEVAHLAAVSLSALSRMRIHPEQRKRIEEVRVGDKCWEFSKDKNDIWRPMYIQGMASCRLKWAEKAQEWFEAIGKADTDELQYGWCRVIEGAYYYEIKDRDALFEILLQILESGEAFTKRIRTAALQRLHSIIREVEPIGFEEKPLNLPLAQRAKIC